jgi:hypothetical protein
MGAEYNAFIALYQPYQHSRIASRETRMVRHFTGRLHGGAWTPIFSSASLYVTSLLAVGWLT